MSDKVVQIRELIGWGFDTYEYRPADAHPASLQRAQTNIAQRTCFEQPDILATAETVRLRAMFAPVAERFDLLAEMAGLSWSLGVVDLRSLVAFQRRLAFTQSITQPSMPAVDDWPALFALCFGSPKPIEYTAFLDRSTETVVLQSNNPNLHIRVTKDLAYPLCVHGGGPLFEVARFHGRWFLRDGYHRAYALLAANVFHVPAVIVEANSLEELGANQAWFFPEEVLFSVAPPLVADFLNEDLVIEYERPQLTKTIRITIEETLKPATPKGEQP